MTLLISTRSLDIFCCVNVVGQVDIGHPMHEQNKYIKKLN